MSTRLFNARLVAPNRASAPCPWCKREHTYDTGGKVSEVLFLRTPCRVKRALDELGLPRVVALRIIT